jgi:hypothetical protein
MLLWFFLLMNIKEYFFVTLKCISLHNNTLIYMTDKKIERYSKTITDEFLLSKIANIAENRDWSMSKAIDILLREAISARENALLEYEPDTGDEIV